MRFVDLTHKLNSAGSIYPGDPTFCCTPFASIEKDGNNIHQLSLGSHIGTHIDAPYHFFESGRKVDEIPLEWLVGSALVIDISERVKAKYKIQWSDLEAHEHKMRETQILLICTGWDRYWGTDEYYHHPFLTKETAFKIMETGVRVLGVDTLSPDETTLEEGAHVDYAVHDVVLGSGHILAENLTNLSALVHDSWAISLVPLKVEGCDGSPVRAYAFQQEL